MKVFFKKLNEKAILPAYQTEHAAAMDIVACLDAPVEIAPHERAMIPTGFAMALPPGYEAQVRARSGLGSKYGIVPANAVGTIDADYRGEIFVPLLNTSNQSFVVEPGMRIAQMIVQQYETVEWEEVDDLDVTIRGTGGFGSTGS